MKSVIGSHSGTLATRGAKTAVTIPVIIAELGDNAAKRFVEFFTANIRNRNTRVAYRHAVEGFLDWCRPHKLGLLDIEPIHVAAYIELLGQREMNPLADPSIKQHLAAIKMLFDWLVTGQIVPTNPAASVRGPKHIVKKGKTQVLSAVQARTLLDSIAIEHKLDEADPQSPTQPNLIGLRDRSLIAIMAFSFARIGAVLAMKVEDYYPNGKRWWLRLHEKGGKFHEVPCHHTLELYLDAYIEAAGLRANPKAPLFRSANRRTGMLTVNPLRRNNALNMVKRRAKAAGLSPRVCCHTFRATGITAYLEEGGTIEKAARIACHESPRTTKLYDRTSDQIDLEEIERIRI
jgi:integrase/recombinase XerD